MPLLQQSQGNSEDLIGQALQFLSNKLATEVVRYQENPSEWIQKHFYVPDPRDPITDELFKPGPIILSEHQIRIIDEALSKNDKGQFNYSTVVYSAVKKSGKSALSAAVALYMAHNTPSSYVACIANDGKQADDRLYGPIQTCFRLHNQLGGIFEGIKYNQTGVVLPNFTKLEPINVDAAGEAGSQPLFTAWCFDEETEILTRDGWKRYDEYTAADDFLTLREDGYLEYQKPLGINIRYYEGPMHELVTRNHNICVSPNHELYGKFFNYSKKDTQFEIKPVEKLPEYNFYGVRVESLGLKEDYIEVPEYVEIQATSRCKTKKIPIKLYLELLGWYLAEGCTHKNEAVLIAQSLDSKYYTEIEDLICRLGYAPKTWKNQKALLFYSTQLATHLKQFGLAHEKFIPKWIKELPKEYIDILLNAYWKGDGYKTGNNVAVGNTLYATNSEKLRDDLVEIAVKQGKYVSYTTYQDKRWGRPIFTINVKKKHDGCRCVSTSTENWKNIEYKGFIHCPSVPNKIILVKRRGKIYLQKQSELWGFTTPKKEKLWSELTLPPTLYGRAIEWIESYAGFTGESEILWNLYETGFLNGVPHPDFEDLVGVDGPVVRTNDSARMFVYWDTEPRMAWQTPEYYHHQAQRMHPSEYQRLHKNQWASSLDSYIQEAWWEACENSDLPLLVDNETPVVVGIDMAVTGDCAAMVAVTRDPFDPISKVAVRGVKIFNPKHLGGIIDQEKVVRPVIEDWANKWNVVCWVYDPREMSKLAQDLVRDGVGWFRPFGQTNPRAVADKALHDMVLSKQISWSHLTTEGDIGYKGGPDDTLYKHITLAGAKTNNESYRIEKLTTNTKIDAAVALSQACSIAMELALDNHEMNLENLIRLYSLGKISEAEFSEKVRKANPALLKRM